MKFRNVCFFLPSAQRDGAELSALECMDALQSLGMQCRVVIPQKGPLIDDLKARRLKYNLIPYKVWIEPPVPVAKSLLVTFWNLIMAYLATFLMARWKCDLVITNTINICVGALVAKVRRLPHLWYLREFGYEDHGWQYHLGKKPSLWLMDRLSVACAAVSRAVAEKYQASMTPSKVHYLYQPINIDLTAPANVVIDKSRFQLTCIIVGRLQTGKRQEDAIRAISELRDRGLHAQLWLVGGGDEDYRTFLEELVREKNLQAQIRFLGQVGNAYPYIQKADVLLLCSRCEAFARVVVEAMKAGKPVVGSRSGGTVEQIKDGFNGFLYEPRDHKALAEKIKYLYEHPEEAQEMGKNGQQYAMKTFNRERYQRELIRIFSSPEMKSSSIEKENLPN
jgi:glycosyltransferase involved in cell wall biosynthesis